MSIILHIGASKCGSSALQTALTKRPNVIRKDGTSVEYVAIDGAGGLIRGKRLANGAGVYGYRNSPDAKRFLNFDLRLLADSIRSIPNDVIISSEGWVFQHSIFEEILNIINLPIDVVFYIRPHVPLLNSAWWQWGAWSGKTYSEWMSNRIKVSMWSKHLAKWQKIDQVKQVTVRLLPRDIVSDFFENILNADAPATSASVNKSLPGPVLRLFQRNPKLRTRPHAGSIDFILSKHMKLSGATPWVLNEEWVNRILQETRADNRRLLTMMDSAMANAMRADPLWWDASAYSEKIAESPDSMPLSADTLETMCVDLIKAIDDLARSGSAKPKAPRAATCTAPPSRLRRWATIAGFR